ncbi:unnamed protein product, partial [Chrysoparadoxa australica]
QPCRQRIPCISQGCRRRRKLRFMYTPPSSLEISFPAHPLSPPSSSPTVNSLPQDVQPAFEGRDGFVSCRVIKGRNGIQASFVEFRDAAAASAALQACPSLIIQGSHIAVEFSRTNSRKRTRDDSSGHHAGHSHNTHSYTPSYGGGQAAMAGMGGGMGRSDFLGGGGVPTMLPRDASNSLYVEGFSADATERELKHIFRPFFGYRNLRLKVKNDNPALPPKHMAFVEFEGPHQAAVALSAVSEYVMDRQDSSQGTLRVQFA